MPATDLGRYTDVATLLTSTFTTQGAFSDAPDAGKLAGLTQTNSQIGQFRTPSLRGVSRTAPYMHSGQLATLQDVVTFYNQGGGTPQDGGTVDQALSPLGLTSQEQTDLIEFLKSLDGEPVPPELLRNTAH